MIKVLLILREADIKIGNELAENLMMVSKSLQLDMNLMVGLLPMGDLIRYLRYRLNACIFLFYVISLSLVYHVGGITKL